MCVRDFGSIFDQELLRSTERSCASAAFNLTFIINDFTSFINSLLLQYFYSIIHPTMPSTYQKVDGDDESSLLLASPAPSLDIKSSPLRSKLLIILVYLRLHYKFPLTFSLTLLSLHLSPPNPLISQNRI
jgi:hypothetical protein